MTSSEREPWTMPEWMEPYRDLIGNTGGNSVESLLNDTKTNGFNNSIRAAMIVSVEDQVRLLGALHKRGLLAAPVSSEPAGGGENVLDPFDPRVRAAVGEAMEDWAHRMLGVASGHRPGTDNDGVEAGDVLHAALAAASPAPAGDGRAELRRESAEMLGMPQALGGAAVEPGQPPVEPAPAGGSSTTPLDSRQQAMLAVADRVDGVMVRTAGEPFDFGAWIRGVVAGSDYTIWTPRLTWPDFLAMLEHVAAPAGDGPWLAAMKRRAATLAGGIRHGYRLALADLEIHGVVADGSTPRLDEVLDEVPSCPPAPTDGDGPKFAAANSNRSELTADGDGLGVCEHCPDGHREPGSRPMVVEVGPVRDKDGQPIALTVSYANGHHVSEREAAWLRALIARPSLSELLTSEEMVEEAAFELYAAGPWGEPFQFADGGVRLITDAHSMREYRGMVQMVYERLAARLSSTTKEQGDG